MGKKVLGLFYSWLGFVEAMAQNAERPSAGHLLSWKREVMSKTISHFLSAALRLNTFYKKECLGRGVYLAKPSGL